MSRMGWDLVRRAVTGRQLSPADMAMDACCLFMASTIEWKQGPKSPSGEMGALRSAYLVASRTSNCCSQRCLRSSVCQAATRTDNTAMDAERVRMKLASFLTSTTSSDFMDVEVEAR